MANQPDFNQLRAVLSQLNPNQARELYRELGAIVTPIHQSAPEASHPQGNIRDVVEIQWVGDRLYQREMIRCGKPNCKCAGNERELHGPYWYVYWREAGKLRSRYIGKKLKFDEPPEPKNCA
ncbi:MAG: DUF6788 family protein [Leptolyngbyaceae cyanobacterium bins.59]|nr:DUF6788 family protein [Leptolyngbyaceae cyanobacterium bins.59]